MNLIDVFLLMIFNSMIIYGIFNAGTFRIRTDVLTVPDKIRREHIEEDTIEAFTMIRVWIENNLGEFAARPLISCPRCMASIHSLIPYAIMFHVQILEGNLHVLLFYPFYICALSALNHAVKKIFMYNAHAIG